jgi:hypothetical protein
VRKLHPRSKTIAVVDYWYDREGSVNLKYHRSFDQYINYHFTAEIVAIILGFKSVKFNRDFSITAEDGLFDDALGFGHAVLADLEEENLRIIRVDGRRMISLPLSTLNCIKC